MLERETDTILATLSAQTIGERESIQLGDVLASDIPRGIKSYIQAETVRWLSDDLFAASRFAQVNRSDPRVSRLARAFLLSMAEAYVYRRSDYLGILENAVHFLENYLCRPQWTIENFVFETGDRVPLQTILAKLEYTVEYSYFKALIEKIARQRAWAEIGLGEFRSLLVSIDDQIVKQHNARELALLAKPIFDFILLRDTPPDIGIPLKPILVFFEDKKMKILRDYIESICGIRQRSDITLDELTALVEDLYLGHTDAAVAAPSTDTDAQRQEPEPVPAQEPESIPERIPIDEPSANIEAPAIFDYVTEDPDGRFEEPPPEPAEHDQQGEEGTPAKSPQGADRKNFSLSLTFAGLDTTMPDAHGLPDLRTIISDHLRSRFIKQLFNRDEQQYEEVMNALNDAGTWKDASLLLNKLYRTNGLDPFEADVVAFTDAIHRRYMDAESEGE